MALATSILAVSACMTSPYDQQQLSSRDDTFTLSGYAGSANAAVTVHAKTPGGLRAVATAVSGTTPLSTSDGYELYPWSVRSSVPRGYWTLRGDVYEAELQASVDGNELVSVRSDWSACWSAHPTISGFHENCLAPTSPIARLRAPASLDVPDDATLTSIQYNGSGCPAGTIAGTLSADVRALTFDFSDYGVHVGPGIPRRESRANCQLTFTLGAPGWSYAVTSLGQRMYALLDADVRLSAAWSGYFQGSGNTLSFDHSFEGFLDDDIRIDDVASPSELAWSPCGVVRSFNVNTTLAVRSRASGGEGYTGSEVSQTLGIRWRRCQ